MPIITEEGSHVSYYDVVGPEVADAVGAKAIYRRLGRPDHHGQR
jgi:hypothetical protein